jgi:hypothetical protein
MFWESVRRMKMYKVGDEYRIIKPELMWNRDLYSEEGDPVRQIERGEILEVAILDGEKLFASKDGLFSQEFYTFNSTYGSAGIDEFAETLDDDYYGYYDDYEESDSTDIQGVKIFSDKQIENVAKVFLEELQMPIITNEGKFSFARKDISLYHIADVLEDSLYCTESEKTYMILSCIGSLRKAGY